MQVVKGVLHREVVPVAWLRHRLGKVSVLNSNDIGVEYFGQLLLISLPECVVGIVAFRDKDGRTVEAHVAYDEPLVEGPHRGVIMGNLLFYEHHVFVLISLALKRFHLADTGQGGKPVHYGLVVCYGLQWQQQE